MLATITVRLSEKLKKQLAAVAADEKVSHSELVRNALVRYVPERNIQRLRKRVLPFAEARGLLTDEDIYKELQR